MDLAEMIEAATWEFKQKLSAHCENLDLVDLTRFGGYLISWEKGDPLCRQHVHLIHLSSKSKWSNWFEPVVRQESWPKSSSPQTRRSGTGWYRPTETRAFEKTV